MLKNDNKVFFDSNCRALIFGSSGAIGSAIVRNLKLKVGDENVTTISRSKDRLDFLDPKGIDFIASKQEGKFRLILDATGALEINNYGPEKSLSALEPKAMMNQFAVNAVGPALLMKHFMHLLSRTNKSVFVTLSARVGSIEDNRLGGWISYRASKAALNQIVKTKVVNVLDHSQIEADVDWFKGKQPSSENILIWIWDQIVADLEQGSLYRLRLVETHSIHTDYYGPGKP